MDVDNKNNNYSLNSSPEVAKTNIECKKNVSQIELKKIKSNIINNSTIINTS